MGAPCKSYRYHSLNTPLASVKFTHADTKLNLLSYCLTPFPFLGQYRPADVSSSCSVLKSPGMLLFRNRPCNPQQHYSDPASKNGYKNQPSSSWPNNSDNGCYE